MGLGRTGGWKKKKTIENRGFQEIHLVLGKGESCEENGEFYMIVSTQLLEGDVCTIYSLLPEHSEDLKDWEFSWTKKNGDTSTPFSFWLKNIVPERKRNSHIEASGLFSNSILSTRDKNLT